LISSCEVMISKNKNKQEIDQLDSARIPRHIAIIMDGNGRWAKRRGLPRIMGHKAGVNTVDRILQECVKLNIEVLTLYTFSTENWSRPQFEVKALMDLLQSNLISQRKKLLNNDIRLQISGNILRFPETIRSVMNDTIEATRSCKKMVLNLALGYSGREEIIQASKRIASEVLNGKLKLDDIDENLFSNRLYTAGLPDPELVIRTSGEFRISNFLLWQSSYSEFYFTKVLWPNFQRKDLISAIVSYQGRDRRFGGVTIEESSA
jgi:undecaprenyl diphosphate synthase